MRIIAISIKGPKLCLASLFLLRYRQLKIYLPKYHRAYCIEYIGRVIKKGQQIALPALEIL